MGRTRNWLKSGFGKVVSYFLQGLLLIAPMVVTIWAVIQIFYLLDTPIEKLFMYLFHFYYPGMGIIVMFFVIAFIGLVGSNVVFQPLLHVLEVFMERVPVVKDIYSSVKDFFGAFISKKKKFDKPVMFEVGKHSGVFRLGFITQEDLSEFGMMDKVAVYAPWSYNLSGTMFVVNKDQVQLLTNDIGAGEMMKFVMSGGVTTLDEDETHHHHHNGQAPK
jgi:uncharacterized membrane protein